MSGEPADSTPTNSTTDIEQDAASDSVDTLEKRLDALSRQNRELWKKVEDLQEQLETERTERERLEDENEDLREDVDRLDARTDLLSLVENEDTLTANQRRISLILHLKKAAERQRERGRPAKASMNQDEAARALHYPDIDRTTYYTDFRKAVELVGNQDVLHYESKSGGESRLKLNLEAGDLPNRVLHANGGV